MENEGIKLIRLVFSAKNPADLLFRGIMFITPDGNYSIQKINMSINKHANLNWVRDLRIKQEFSKGPDGRYHVVSTNTIAEFSLTKGSGGAIVGERTVSLKNFIINQPAAESIYAGVSASKEPNENGENLSDSFWIAHRSPQLTVMESKVYSNIDSLKNMRSYKNVMD